MIARLLRAMLRRHLIDAARDLGLSTAELYRGLRASVEELEREVADLRARVAELDVEGGVIDGGEGR